MGIGENVGENVGENTGQQGDSLAYFGRIFYDDFEDGTLDKWTHPARPGVFPEVLGVGEAYDGGSPNSGSYMAGLNWTSTDYAGIKLLSWSYTREFFVRLYLRYDEDMGIQSGVSVNRTGNKLFRMGWNNESPVNSELLFTTNEKSEDSDPDILHPTLTINGTPTHAYPSNTFFNYQWHKVEIYMDNHSSGKFKVWLEDSLIINYSGNTIGDTNDWTNLYIPSNWTTNNPTEVHDDTNHMYLDSVEIFSDTGRGASGSMSDATVQA